MRKYFLLILFSFVLLSSCDLFSQNKKPKVALVLSGGGAKGIAHISTLQILDSLGIVPDLIIGTSMGSVVGGLYAMGYSGDSIAAIASKANWGELIGGSVSLKDVSVEEKSEFKKHMIDFDWVKGKPKVGSSLLNDQNLREFFSVTTFPVYNVKNFDELPIPFRAIATDIVNGKEVILDKGSLAVAMRASMSIPTIFRPVPYENTLLVDGGVLDNFPVDIAKDMGADIIIGSDVGSGMQPKEKLDNMASLLFQTGMLNSLLKNPENRALCDILVNHEPNLTYSTGDFDKSDQLYEQGKIATYQNIEQFVRLAHQLKKYKQRDHQLPIVNQDVQIDTIIFNGISEANIELVKARAKLTSHKSYTTQEVLRGIRKAMGTNLFYQITTETSIKNDGKVALTLNVLEKSSHQIKGSLHYDSFRGVGIIANYTGRNIFGDASRFLVTLDIAQQPGFRVQYQKNFGNKYDWWLRSEVLGQRLVQKFYFNGEKAEEINNGFFQFDNQINKNFSSLKSFAGVGLNYESSKLKPAVNPDINDNVFDLRNYYFKNFEINAHYMFNNLDKVFYPTKGTFFYAELARSIIHNVNVEFVEQQLENINGKTNGFSKLILNFEQRLPINKKITGIVKATTAFTFVDNLETKEISFVDYGVGGKYFLGGNLLRPRRDNYIFPGLNESELIATQFMMINLGVQTQWFKNFFITPHANIATVGFTGFKDYLSDAFNPQGNWQEVFDTSLLVSGGITASYNSFLGPVNFDISWVNNINKVRLFFGIGIQFNRSY